MTGEVRLSGISGTVTVTNTGEDREAARKAAETIDGRENRREIRERRKLALDVVTFVIAVATLISAFVYAHLTAQQLQTARQGLELTRQQFIAEQRPFVLTDHVLKHVGPEGKTYVDVGLDNFGKSPAIRVVDGAMAFYGPNARNEAYAYLKMLHLYAGPNGSADSIPPAAQPDKPFQRFTVGIDAAALHYLSVDWNVVVAAKITYSDLTVSPDNRKDPLNLNNPYTTDACYGFLANGSIAKCGPEGNEIQ